MINEEKGILPRYFNFNYSKWVAKFLELQILVYLVSRVLQSMKLHTNYQGKVTVYFRDSRVLAVSGPSKKVQKIYKDT